MNKTEFRLNEKEAAHYISNAAALWVLGIGFCAFAHKVSSPFTSALCFWFSVFLLCDGWRQARVAARLERNKNLIATMSEEGITHYGSWLQPETLSWKQIRKARLFKGIQSEIFYLETETSSKHFFRYMLFGMPKFDIPVSSLKNGKEGFFAALSSYSAARHLVPERASGEDFQKAA
jgi:hypothetical protein